ncbi:acyl-CoA dehydrogenase [Mycolicibacterium porcinum]|uniref:acyl-CoA dehydrogenase n=1 Tax=Mycolicibacterium porcinum TaxID=39693 RepID=UPI0011908062|nr:acyl-CoA dehydrogenase [Mycolicibacterium porcinum]TVX99337.1 acyl-CoA dehydrogenase [Mycolicibacterium porcinum]
MPVALTDDHSALAETVAGFAARHGSRESTRKNTAEHRAGERPDHWQELVSLGLQAVHLPEEVGGQGGSINDLAVVVAETGRALLPGPLLPTVSASAIVSTARADTATGDVLKRFSAGASAAVLGPPSSLTISGDAGRIRLNGLSAPTLGGGSADLFVVAARPDTASDTEPVWLVVDRLNPDIDVEVVDGVDLGRDMAVVRFGDADVTDAVRLNGIDGDLAADIAVTMMAVEAAGIIAWCSDAATEFIKTRIQFGRPIGAFQAVQHRAAQLRITSELATASAWDAVRALTESADQRTHAVAGAAIMTLGRAVHAAVECVALHGAIGFTWEHDVHLYWRRAIALAALAGPVESWEKRLGEVAVHGPRTFALTLPDAEVDFRSWVSDILDQAASLENSTPSMIGATDAVAMGPRRNLLAEHGLVAPSWPRPWGLDASPLQQLIIQEEFDRRGIEVPSMAIGQWVMPVVLKHGTPEQIERLDVPTLRGELVWCQLFSEPGAGSDVASLSLRADRTEGGWTLTGQKIWTTQAHLAHWGLCLVRTGAEDSRHRGLSMFLIDMTSPQLDVRPIRQANGEAEFNEVFFNDVFVPDAMLIGQPGDGWALTLDTLAQERQFIGTYRETGNEQRIRQIINDHRYAGSRDDALCALGRISARGAAIAAMNLRETLRRLDGHSPGPATSISKAAASMLHTDAAAAALNLLGPAGALNETACEPVFHELDIPTWVIGGGTLEIQLNTIATFVLGLPRR